ncbi:MFS transporter [Exophiala viscosa]|uniref:MFS transporter n=1 Tax=Exophiala viscosa TaxID=2486360 RepID=UPI00219B9CD6|nr:MFS transporter [Exophiala viscosa]
MTIYSVLRRIVRNDAIRVDPPEVYNWRVLALTASACFAGTMFGMDAGIIGGYFTVCHLVEDSHHRKQSGLQDVSEFGLDNLPASAAANLSGNLVTTMQAGAIAGALVSSPLAEKKGRKPALLAVAIAGIVGGLMQGLSFGHLSVFYIGRFIEGLGLGAGTMLAPTYVSEISPRAIRGFLVGFFQLLLDTGTGKATWMVPLMLQSLAPALLLITMLMCPESPRWLASRDHWDKATSVLSDVRRLPPQHTYVQQELLELRVQLENENRIRGDTGFWALQKECWTQPGNRKRALLTILILVFNQWSGTGAINYYARTIFQSLGLSKTTTALFAQGVYGIVKTVAALIFAFFLADSLGRRISFMWSGAVQAFCMLFIGFASVLTFSIPYVRYGPHVSVNQSPPPAGIAALAMIYIFAAAFNSGWGPVAWVYVSEIPSNRLRAYNVALASFTHWVNNLAVSKATPGDASVDPVQNDTESQKRKEYVLTKLILPISLERMDELFGVVDMSNIEDVGIAAQQDRKAEETLEMQNVRTTKA